MLMLAMGLMIVMLSVETAEQVGRDTQAVQQMQAARSLGENLLVIRNALESYLHATPSAVGAIALGDLGLPSWFIADQRVHALVQDGIGYVYYTPDQPLASVSQVLGAEPSGLTGIALNQQLHSPSMGFLTTLPAAIPDQSVVLVLYG